MTERPHEVFQGLLKDVVAGASQPFEPPGIYFGFWEHFSYVKAKTDYALDLLAVMGFHGPRTDLDVSIPHRDREKFNIYLQNIRDQAQINAGRGLYRAVDDFLTAADELKAECLQGVQEAQAALVEAQRYT